MKMMIVMSILLIMLIIPYSFLVSAYLQQESHINFITKELEYYHTHVYLIKHISPTSCQICLINCSNQCVYLIVSTTFELAKHSIVNLPPGHVQGNLPSPPFQHITGLIYNYNNVFTQANNIKALRIPPHDKICITLSGTGYYAYVLAELQNYQYLIIGFS